MAGVRFPPYGPGRRRPGLFPGVQLGPVDAPVVASASMAGVTQDATSGIYVPANASEWTQTLAVAGISSGNPSALYLLQEAAGNPADSIGSFTLTASGTLAYQQAVAGWTRTGIATTAGSAGTLISTDAGLPAINTSSMLLLAYVRIQADVTGTTRTLLGMGTTFDNDCSLHYTTSDFLQCKAATNTATSAVDTATDAVRPFVARINRTGSTAAGFNDVDKLEPAIGGTGKRLLLGGANIAEFNPLTATYIYAAAFFLGAAELSNAQVKTLLQTLGWTITWTP